MKIRLSYKFNENNIREVYIDFYEYKHSSEIICLSVPTGIIDRCVNKAYSTIVHDIPLIYKGNKLSSEELCFQVIKDHLLLGHLFNIPIDLDDLQSGYIDKYKLPFCYDSNKEQVVNEDQFKTWLELNEDNLLIISDRLAYYIG